MVPTRHGVALVPVTPPAEGHPVVPPLRAESYTSGVGKGPRSPWSTRTEGSVSGITPVPPVPGSRGTTSGRPEPSTSRSSAPHRPGTATERGRGSRVTHSSCTPHTRSCRCCSGTCGCGRWRLPRSSRGVVPRRRYGHTTGGSVRSTSGRWNTSRSTPDGRVATGTVAGRVAGDCPKEREDRHRSRPPATVDAPKLVLRPGAQAPQGPPAVGVQTPVPDRRAVAQETTHGRATPDVSDRPTKPPVFGSIRIVPQFPPQDYPRPLPTSSTRSKTVEHLGDLVT